jgi:DNA-directed RNA polymerase beta subunit
MSSDDGSEDSGVCTEKIAKDLTTQVIYQFDHVIEKDSNVYYIAKIGSYVNVGDPLLIWQDPFEDEDANALLKYINTKDDELSTIGRRTIESDTTGRVVDIKIYRTCEIKDMSESLQKIVNAYEKPIKELKSKLEQQGLSTTMLPATYALEPTGKLKKAQDALIIEIYVEHDDIVGVGDKIVYLAANKAVIKTVIPEGKEPYTDFRPNEEVSALLSVSSINHRMVTSIIKNGVINKLLIELDRSVKDMAGIKYDPNNL